jgi:hypothetical protein
MYRVLWLRSSGRQRYTVPTESCHFSPDIGSFSPPGSFSSSSDNTAPSVDTVAAQGTDSPHRDTKVGVKRFPGWRYQLRPVAHGTNTMVN